MSLAGRPSEQNGNSARKYPPPIEWNDAEPPFIFNCSQHVEHVHNCDGNCGGEYATEGIVRLINVKNDFLRHEMLPQGVIEAYRGMPILPGGLGVDPFDVLMWCITLKEIVVEAGLISMDELDEKWRNNKAERLESVVASVGKQVKEQHTLQSLGIKPPSILGPDGQPI